MLGCLRDQGEGQWTRNDSVRSFRRWRYDNPADKRLDQHCHHDGAHHDAFDFFRCPLQPLRVRELCHEIADSNVLFVGDSLQVHFYLAFFMFLRPDVNTTRHLGLPKSDTTRMPSLTVCEEFVPGGVQLDMLREDWLTIPPGRGKDGAPASLSGAPSISHSRGGWLKHLATKDRGWARNRSTLLILTAGSHIWPRKIFIPHLRRVVDALGNRSASAPRVRVVLRNSIAGHLECSIARRALISSMPEVDRDAGRFIALAEASNATQLANLSSFAQFWEEKAYHQYHWDLVNEMRPEIDDMFRAAGFFVLNADASAKLRPDLHPGEVGPGRYDCLHYCPSGPVYAAWALTLANMIDQWGAFRAVHTVAESEKLGE